MIRIIYMGTSVLPIANAMGKVYLRNDHPNRVWMDNEAHLHDTQSGFTIYGPQFMLVQLLFFLNVKVSMPYLSLEREG